MFKQPLKSIIDATNTHNFDEVKKYVHKDAFYIFSGQMLTGLETIRAYFEKTWDTIKNEEYWATDVTWLHDGNTSKTCVYQYNYRGYVDGKIIEGHGQATNVFVKCEQTKDWLLIHEHLSK